MTENNMTFGELLAEWLPTVKNNLTQGAYESIERDADFLTADIGNMPITDMTVDFLTDYFSKLDKRTHEVGYAVAKKDIRAILLRNGYRRDVLRKEMGIMSSTLSYVYNRSKITVKWAAKFSEQLNLPYEELFDDYSEQKPYAPATMQRTKSTIRQALGYAKTKGYIDENYAMVHFIRSPKIVSTKATAPTDEEMHRFFYTAINYPDIRVRTAMLLLFAFDFNRIEVSNLDWNCFDFDRNTISHQTKTVNIPAVIMAIFKDYQVWQKKKEPFDNPYIFRKSDGTKTHRETMKGWFRKTLKRANLQEYTLKDFQQAHFDYTSIPITDIPKIETVGRQQYYVDPMRQEMYKLGFKTYNEYLDYLEFLSAIEARANKHKNEMI